MNKKLNQEDFWKAYKDKKSELETYCTLYDAGNRVVIYSIATIIRVFLHDTKTSTSILKHLNLKDRLFLSTGYDDPRGNIMEYLRLIFIHIEGPQSSFQPRLGENTEGDRWVNFNYWWNQKILDFKNGEFFTRHTVIDVVANKFGGAHVDKAVSESEYKLLKNDSSNWMKGSNDNEQTEKLDPDGPHYPTVRQIAFELLKTLDKIEESTTHKK